MVAALLLSGCGVKSSPPVDEYTIKPKLSLNSTKETKCRQKEIKVLSPFAPYKFTTNDLHYIVLQYEEGRFNRSAWSESVASSVYNEIVDTLRKSALFKSVQNYSSVAKHDYLLEIQINDFMQYFSKDLKSSYAVVDITLTLVDRQEYRVIAQKNFVKRAEVSRLDAKGGIEVLNALFAQTLEEMVVWLEGVCG